MSRTKTYAAILALGLGAAACAPTDKPLSAYNNPSLYSVHQPVVQRTDYVIDVNTGPAGVPASELARLDAWFASIELGYGDRVSIDAPYGRVEPETARDIASVAGRYGILLADAAPVTAGQVPPGAVRVIASRATASVPSCPAFNSENVEPKTTTSPNYGCAINSNIAAMVANPNDLVLGQPGSVNGSAATATRAIGTYREAQPTGLQGLPKTSTTED